MRTLKRRTYTTSDNRTVLAVSIFTLLLTIATAGSWTIFLVEGIQWNTPFTFVPIGFTAFTAYCYLMLITMVALSLRYGDSTLEISAYPAESGGALSGTLTTGAYLARQDEIRLRLVQLEVSRVRMGDTSNIWEEALWKQELLIDPRTAEVFQGKCTIPFRFEGVPSEPEPEDLKAAVVWQIQAQGKGRRPKYLELFTLTESGSPWMGVPGRRDGLA